MYAYMHCLSLKRIKSTIFMVNLTPAGHASLTLLFSAPWFYLQFQPWICPWSNKILQTFCVDPIFSLGLVLQYLEGTCLIQHILQQKSGSLGFVVWYTHHYTCLGCRDCQCSLYASIHSLLRSCLLKVVWYVVGLIILSGCWFFLIY